MLATVPGLPTLNDERVADATAGRPVGEWKVHHPGHIRILSLTTPAVNYAVVPTGNNGVRGWLGLYKSTPGIRGVQLVFTLYGTCTVYAPGGPGLVFRDFRGLGSNFAFVVIWCILLFHDSSCRRVNACCLIITFLFSLRLSNRGTRDTFACFLTVLLRNDRLQINTLNGNSINRSTSKCFVKGFCTSRFTNVRCTQDYLIISNGRAIETIFTFRRIKDSKSNTFANITRRGRTIIRQGFVLLRNVRMTIPTVLNGL